MDDCCCYLRILFADLGYCGGYYGGYYGDFCGDCCGSSCGGCRWVGISFINLACCASYLGAVGVRGDVSALKWYGAYVDGACPDRAYPDGACADGACTDGA